MFGSNSSENVSTVVAQKQRRATHDYEILPTQKSHCYFVVDVKCRKWMFRMRNSGRGTYKRMFKCSYVHRPKILSMKNIKKEE